MSTQHTQGPLIVWPDNNRRFQVGPSTNYTVAQMMQTPLHNQEANARRLVACWNACEGLSTEALERLGTLDRARVELDVIRAQAIAQRDELLNEMRQAMRWAGHRDEVRRILSDAIAKVEGGAA